MYVNRRSQAAIARWHNYRAARDPNYWTDLEADQKHRKWLAEESAVHSSQKLMIYEWWVRNSCIAVNEL